MEAATVTRARFPLTPRERAMGKRLRERRKALELALAKVAYECGLHVNALRKIELGKGDPSVRTLRVLAKRYRMSADEILFGS